MTAMTAMTTTPVLWGDTPVTWGSEPVTWGVPALPVPVCLVASPAFTTTLDALVRLIDLAPPVFMTDLAAPLRLVHLSAVPVFTTHIAAEVHLCPR